jgi:sugar phosphate permease
MATTLGWRMSFELIGGCTLVSVTLVRLVVRDRPEDKGWSSIARIDAEKRQKSIRMLGGQPTAMHISILDCNPGTTPILRSGSYF